MTFVNTPSIGQWYTDSQHRYFEVVAMNDDEIEIQYIDGAVDEIENDTWLHLTPTTAAEPRDARGLYEEMEVADSDIFADWQVNDPLSNGWQGFLDKWE